MEVEVVTNARQAKAPAQLVEGPQASARLAIGPTRGNGVEAPNIIRGERAAQSAMLTNRGEVAS